jgi:hypothetical protein
MDREQFWAVIEAARTAGDGDCKRLTDHVVAALSRLPTDEILAFDRIFRGVRPDPRLPRHRWCLWLAGSYLISIRACA